MHAEHWHNNKNGDLVIVVYFRLNNNKEIECWSYFRDVFVADCYRITAQSIRYTRLQKVYNAMTWWFISEYCSQSHALSLFLILDISVQYKYKWTKPWNTHFTFFTKQNSQKEEKKVSRENKLLNKDQNGKKTK